MNGVPAGAPFRGANRAFPKTCGAIPFHFARAGRTPRGEGTLALLAATAGRAGRKRVRAAFGSATRPGMWFDPFVKVQGYHGRRPLYTVCSKDSRRGLTLGLARGPSGSFGGYSLTLSWIACFGEGFRTPALCGTAVRDAGAGVRKPPKEETAGRKGAVWLAAIYGDLRIADATRASARRPVERRPIGGRNEGDPVRW